MSILCTSRWCFQTLLIFTPIWGNNPILTNIFQMGWFNHKPDMFFFLSGKMSFWTDLWNLQWFIGCPKPSGFYKIPKGDLNRPWKSTTITTKNPVIFCRCDSNFSFVWKQRFTPFYPGRIRVHMGFFWHRDIGFWCFFHLKRFQLTVNCLFRLVVWIPGSPYEKGIVTEGYPDSNPKTTGPLHQYFTIRWSNACYTVMYQDRNKNKNRPKGWAVEIDDWRDGYSSSISFRGPIFPRNHATGRRGMFQLCPVKTKNFQLMIFPRYPFEWCCFFMVLLQLGMGKFPARS